MKKLLVLNKAYSPRRVTVIDVNSKIFEKIKGIELPSFEKNEVNGATPPEVFVGRVGYPNVYVGPVIPLSSGGDASNYASPEKWFGKSINEIIQMRLLSLRTKKRIHIINSLNSEKFIEDIHYAMLSEKAVDAEAKLKSAPKGFILSDDFQPFGPSALIENLKVYPQSSNKKLEKIYYQNDIKASEAFLYLWKEGVEVSKIQQALSIGMLGVERKIVPTRWSITAVDSTLSNTLLEKIKTYPTINEYRVYTLKYLDNLWVIIFFPQLWSYESMEAWYPGTVLDDELGIGSDYEPFEGRKTYASIGGCYYSARLAIAEKLFSERRQASVLVLREAHEGYFLPVGVWNVRESVRRALQKNPEKFETAEEALKYAESKLTIPLKVWRNYSKILSRMNFQKTLF